MKTYVSLTHTKYMYDRKKLIIIIFGVYMLLCQKLELMIIPNKIFSPIDFEFTRFYHIMRIRIYIENVLHLHVHSVIDG